MSQRTYLPTLIFLARRIREYVVTHRETIRENLTDTGNAALDALMAALDVLIPLVESQLESPT